MIHKIKKHLAPHATTLALGLLLALVSVVATVRVMSADVSRDVAQRGETVVVRSMSYPTEEFTVLQGSVLETPLHMGCLGSPEGDMTYLADTNIFAQIQGVGGSNVEPLLFSKPLATGTRLGEFGPATTCNGQYAYTAEVLN